jgi:MFS family permease
MSDFKKLISARFFFNFAVRMQAVIVGWQMYVLTKDALHLGLIGLAEAVPALSIAVYAGYLVDRSRPVRVFGGVLLGSLLSAGVVFLAQLPAVGLTLHGQVVALYVASVITGSARGFSQPAMYAILPRIMARDRLSHATAWMSSALQLAAILGPALGGLVFGWLGVATAAFCPCVGLILGLISVTAIRADIRPRPRAKAANIKEELFSGAVFVFRHPILLPALSLDMISVLFGGVTALLPIYAADVLNIGAKGLGLLRAAPALGSALASFTLTRLDIRADAGRWLFSAVTGFGVTILVFGLSHSFWLSMIALAFSGAFDSVSVVVRSTAVQLASPDDMRGRISAVNSIFIGSSNELGEFESGTLANFIGAVPAVVLGGVICLVTVTIVGVCSPRLRRLNLNELEAG